VGFCPRHGARSPRNHPLSSRRSRTQRWAERIDAGAYAEDAGDGVEKIDALLGEVSSQASLGPLTPAVRSY